MGTVCLVAFLALFFGFPLVVEHFHVDQPKWELARFMILGTAVAFLTDLWLGAFKCLLEGIQEIALTQIIWLSATLLEVFLVIVFLVLGFGIKGVMFAYVIKTFGEIFVDMAFAFRKMPDLKIRPMLKRESFEALFVFGGKVQVLGMIDIFLASLDRLVTTALIGLEATGLFEVGRKIPFAAKGISESAFAPFFPAASSMDHVWQNSTSPRKKERIKRYGALCLLAIIGSAFIALPLCGIKIIQSATYWSSPYAVLGVFCILVIAFPGVWLIRRWQVIVKGSEFLQANELKRLYLKGSRNMALINGVIYIFLFVTAEELLQAWVGPGYDRAVLIIRIIAVTAFIHLSTGVGTTIFRGLNRVGRELEYLILHLVLALIWIPLLAWHFGLYGAVIGHALSVIPASLYFILRSNSTFRTSNRGFLRYIGTPLLLPAGIGAGVFCLYHILPDSSRWITLGEILLIGAAYLAVNLWGLKKFFLTENEWQTLQQSLPLIPG